MARRGGMHLLAILLACAAAFRPVSASDVDTSFERAQLQSFYSMFDNSDNVLADWTGDDYCSWSGVTCNNDGAVIELNLYERGLRGTVSNMGFGTTLPMYLEVLNLDSNELYGEFAPPGAFALSMFPFSIKDVRLARNKLSGTLDFLGNIFRAQLDIEIFDIAYNNFTGSIPTYYQDPAPSNYRVDYKLPSSLKWMALQGNSLSGTLPSFPDSPDVYIYTLPQGNTGLCGETPEAPQYVDEKGDTVELPNCLYR